MRNLILTISIIVLLVGCGSKRHLNGNHSDETRVEASVPVVMSSPVMDRPKAVIYKTKNDYINLVPITLDASKTKVISYPAPSDLVNAVPTKLIDGYLLDNRGIGINTVFTRFTYEEYSRLKDVPSVAELLSSIVDSDPFVEIYVTREAKDSSNGIDFYNDIVNNNFAGCDRIK
ncbi:MAG: hypothetical protein J1F10_00480 [Muribaculaceae bacterium]|nr:hypothetical protein [Muribaculaceae bacterium]